MAGTQSAHAPGDGAIIQQPRAPLPHDRSMTQRRNGALFTFTAGATSGFAGPDFPQEPADHVFTGPPPPLNVLAVPEHYPEAQGHTWVLPQAMPSREGMPPYPARACDPDRYSGWVREHGGVDLSFTYIRLILENGWSSPVSITGIDALVRRFPPLCGTLLWAPPRGKGVPAEFGFNLDEPEPSALELTRTGGSRSGRPAGCPQRYLSCRLYLQRHPIRLGHRETVTVVALAGTAWNYCEFSISITGTVNEQRFYQVVTDNGSPFRVTAAPAGFLRSIPFSLTGAGYGAVYDGSDQQGWHLSGAHPGHGQG